MWHWGTYLVSCATGVGILRAAPWQNEHVIESGKDIDCNIKMTYDSIIGKVKCELVSSAKRVEQAFLNKIEYAGEEQDKIKLIFASMGDHGQVYDRYLLLSYSGMPALRKLCKFLEDAASISAIELGTEITKLDNTCNEYPTYS